MKKILFGFLVVVLVVGFGRVYYMKSQLASRYSLQDLQKIATGANKTLPVMIDQQTKLNEVVAADRLLEKRYTVVGAAASEALRNEIENKLFPLLKTQSCQNKQSMNFYNSGVAEAFTYSDMNGKHIATLRIDKSSCK